MKIIAIIFSILIFFCCTGKSVDKSKATTDTHKDEQLHYKLLSGENIMVVPEFDMIIIIDGNKFNGQGLVNKFFGQLSDGKVHGPVGSTMMAGPEDKMKMESYILSQLDGSNFNGIGSDTLKIIKDNRVVLTYIRYDN